MGPHVGDSVRFVIRRSFRFGLIAGLLAGLVAAVVKVLGSRSEVGGPAVAAPDTGPWPRLEADPAVPAPPQVGLVPDPDAPAPASTEPVEAAAPPAPAKQTAAKKATAKRKAPLRAWVEPTGDVCPTSHPVKAKLASKIFHLPGMLNYDRTKPDRCYLNAAAAESDGLRPAKR